MDEFGITPSREPTDGLDNSILTQLRSVQPDGDNSTLSTSSPASSPSSTLELGSALLLGHGSKFEPPDKRFLKIFPTWLENRLAFFDDTVLQFAQKADAKLFFYLNMALTYAMALEISVAAPLALFILGWDAIAIDIMYLALILATLSQIPKRFLWRYRPYMVGRGQCRKKTTTSSFPSRAVACATVYAYIIARAVGFATDGSFSVRWWHFVLLLTLLIAISFARINLGVHYPSDCIAGFLLGVLVCFIGFGASVGDAAGCGSCIDNSCYAVPGLPSTELDISSLIKINWLRFGLTLAFSLLIGIAFIVPPIQFWTKFIRVFGLLLPTLLWRYTFLCPQSTVNAAALSAPVTESGRPWYIWVFAIIVTATSLSVATIAPAKHAIVSYSVFYIILFCILSAWRLFIL